MHSGDEGLPTQMDGEPKLLREVTKSGARPFMLDLGGMHVPSDPPYLLYFSLCMPQARPRGNVARSIVLDTNQRSLGLTYH